ncbi:hypothetical protein ARMSODRAFT_786974 [Armillaria solidipes]|uniref:Uncharacterized protein n=1 Tax=Armillaria solidipes TaxID=1076256 RepID=A0A2H3C070_9AGAR|nr:hypothetical protein ARMSODRAFT_786974 [Armillaria solidipes]
MSAVGALRRMSFKRVLMSNATPGVRTFIASARCSAQLNTCCERADIDHSFSRRSCDWKTASKRGYIIRGVGQVPVSQSLLVTTLLACILTHSLLRHDIYRCRKNA